MRIALGFLLLFSSISLLNSASATAQWQQLPGPYGGSTTAFAAAANSGVIFASTESGVYVSRDTGHTWSSPQLRDSIIAELAAIKTGPSVIAFAGGNYGAYRSVDSGKTWTLLNVHTNNNSRGGGYHLTAVGSVLMVLAPDTTLWSSNDLGASWIKVIDPLTSQYRQILSSQDFVFAMGYGNTNIYRSGTQGQNWELASTPQGYDVYSLSSVGSTLVAGLNGGIAISTDHGSTWLYPANGGIDTADHIMSVAGNGLNLIALGIHVYASNDGGRSWHSIEGKNGLPATTNVSTIEWVNDRFFYSSDAGIYTSSNGTDWINSSQGELASRSFDLLSYKGVLYSADAQGIFRSTDHGMTWIEPQGPRDLKDSLATSLAILDGNLYASGNGLWKFDGTTWLTISDEAIDKVLEVDSVWYAEIGRSQVVSSIDGGATWTPTGTGLPVNGHIFSFFVAQKKLFVAALAAGGGAVHLYASSNHGADWIENSATQDWDITGAADSPAGIFLSTYGGLLRSTDAGETWRLDTSFSYNYVTAATSFNGGVLVSVPYDHYGGKSAGFYFSRDGVHWMPELGSIEAVSGFTTDSQYAYARTYSRGIWRTSIASLDVPRVRTARVTSVSAYPNPTDRAIRIATGHATSVYAISIFDESGTLRTSLAEVRSDAQGELLLDLHDLPNGGYNIILRGTSLSSAPLDCQTRIIVEHR